MHKTFPSLPVSSFSSCLASPLTLLSQLHVFTASITQTQSLNLRNPNHCSLPHLFTHLLTPASPGSGSICVRQEAPCWQSSLAMWWCPARTTKYKRGAARSLRRRISKLSLVRAGESSRAHTDARLLARQEWTRA